MIRHIITVLAFLALGACQTTEGSKTEPPIGVSSTARNLGHTCADQSWRTILAPGPQEFKTRPPLDISGRPTYPVVFGPVEGRFAKVYGFFQRDGNCKISRAVTVGSYARTSEFMLSNGNAGPDGRGYHADLYLPNKHVTLGFYKAPPSYEEAQALARKALK